MLWLRRRQEARRLAQADAEALIRDHGAEAHSEARQREHDVTRSNGGYDARESAEIASKKPPETFAGENKTKESVSPDGRPDPSSVTGNFLSDVSDFKPGACVNCGAPAGYNHLLFCGERCRQIGELIRYARRKIADGKYDSPDVAEAIASRRSQLIVGFYDKWARKVSADVRLELLARSDGVCAQCGRPFTAEGDARFTVQHSTFEGCEKLEAWCYRCNMEHSLSGLRELTPDQSEFAAWFDFRVRFPTPVAACDDQDNWPNVYPGLMAAARAARKSPDTALRPTRAAYLVRSCTTIFASFGPPASA